MATATATASQVQWRDAGTLALSGELTFATAAAVYRDGCAALADPAHTPRQLNLAAVAEADSAGLACVLALLAAGQRSQPRFAASHAPDGLRALARVSDADHWLTA